MTWQSRITVISMLAITIVAIPATLFLSVRDRNRARANIKNPAPVESGAESGDEERRQEEWFLFQREYPFKTIKANARRNAWEDMHTQEAFTAQSGAPAWSPIGPQATTTDFSTDPIESGRINSIAICPTNPQVVLVGGASGGIWRSTDGAQTFAPMTDNQVDLAVGSIEFSPNNPSVVYAGMGDPYGGYLGTGVLKSTDQGATWSRVDNGSLPQPGSVTRVRVDPANPDRVYLAQYSQLEGDTLFSSGFYVSTDGGVSWNKTIVGLPRDILINPANPQELFLGMSRVDPAQPPKPAGVYRSTDGGLTWAPVLASTFPQGLTADINLAMSADGATIYAYSGGENKNNEFSLRLVASTDGGNSWKPRSTTGLDPNQFGYDTYIAVDPSNFQTIYIGSRDIYKSTDGGNEWTNITMGYTEDVFTPQTGITHVDQHSIAFVPGAPGAFYAGNDGGLSLTTDGGASFVQANSSLSLTQFYAIAADPLAPSLAYGGAQDNGVQGRVQGNQWNQMLTGDGGHVVVLPTNSSLVLAADEGGDIFRFNDFNELEGSIANNGTFGENQEGGRVAFVAPLTNNGVDQTLYFGTWRLFETVDLGDHWIAPAGSKDLTKGVTSAGSDVLSAIGVTAANPQVIYTGSALGRVMVSSNGGKNWTDITAGLPDRSVTSIVVDHQNPNTAYVTFSGYDTGHVFMTTNMGGTWTDISGNLPDLPVNTLLIDPRNANALYIGNDIGVYQLPAGSSSWQPFNNGLPPVVVTSMVGQPTGLIQAGTYGRGAYQIMTAAPASGLQVVPSTLSATVTAGRSIQIPIAINGTGGFSGNVALSVNSEQLSPLPFPSATEATYISASISSDSVGVGGSTALNIAAVQDAPPATYIVGVTGNQGPISHSALITVTLVGPDYSLGFQEDSIVARRGSTFDVTVVVTPIMGFSDRVTVGPDTFQGPVQVKGPSTRFIQNGTGDATFKFKVPTFVPPGFYLLPFSAVDTRNVMHSANLQLIIQ